MFILTISILNFSSFLSIKTKYLRDSNFRFHFALGYVDFVSYKLMGDDRLFIILLDINPHGRYSTPPVPATILRLDTVS